MARNLPVRRALRIYQGDTKRIPMRWYSDRKRTEPKDVSGRTYSSQVKTEVGGSVLLTATVDMSEAANGLVQIVFPAAQTAAVAVGNYVYDIQEVNESGDVTTLLASRATVEGEVTT